LVSYYHRNYFRQAFAHYLLPGTVNPYFCFDKGLTTNIGLTERISIFYKRFYIDSDYEKYVLNAFVAEYKLEYGAGFCPKKDDKFIIAEGLYFM
jgi:hypothetical protein